MKILIVSNKIPYPPNDGGAIASLNLALALAQNNIIIDFLAIRTPKHNFDISKIPEQISSKIKFYDFFIDTDIKITDLLKNLLFSDVPYNAERFINNNFSQKLAELLQNNSYDIVQLEGLYVMPYIETIKKNSNAVISYRAHNIEHEIWQRTLENTTNHLKKSYLKILVSRLKKFELSFINKYDIILPITERDKKIFAELGNKKPALTIPTGINISEYEPYWEKINKADLCFIGSLDWMPNQEGLIWFVDEIFPQIIEKLPKTKFFIAGRNAPDWLVKKIQKENIIFEGQVEDAKKFISEHKIFIVPLLSGSGMRIKIIEAMALQKTVITTSIGAEGINAKNNEIIIIEDKPENFVSKTIELLQNGQKADSIGQQASVFISKKFDNFAIAKHLSDFYVNYLNSKV